MMKPLRFALKPLVLLLAATPLAGLAQVAQFSPVVVTAPKTGVQPLNAAGIDEAGLAAQRPATSDTARLLRDIPGVSLYGAGGVSSLPSIHGMADDRLRIKVDGMDLISACANHMNPALSYIDPSSIGSIAVFAGITPVSMGGDSIGGTIVVNSAAPEFAKTGQGTLVSGRAGTFYRSNANAHGANVGVTVAGEKLNVSYAGSTAQAGTYKAGKDFKIARLSTGTNSWVSGNEVASTGYKTENQLLGFALRHENHQVELKFGMQRIPYQGFPNQYMDMTGNDSHQTNLRYTGQFQWGALEARAYTQNTRHKMNFLEDKLSLASPLGMPMDTEGKTQGALIKADIVLSQRDILKLGSEYQRYRLNDWWGPISNAPMGMMSPNTFWNINNGQRDHFDVFGEWEARWNPQWLSQLGVRSARVKMDTGTVQGYNNNALGMMGMGYQSPTDPSTIPGAFNAASRSKSDNNVDLTALARYVPSAQQTFEAGYARKTRSPNLYERYAWSTTNSMVMNMVNWSGDANGYVGNLDLKPETANTLSATANWHDANSEKWGLKVTPYYTHVQDYIDASRCRVGSGVPCTAANRDAKTGFVFLQFVNQSARIYGTDISGFVPVASAGSFGSFTATGVLSYVNGKNQTTGDNLYNIMPLNLKLALVQRLGSWTNSVETEAVDSKTRVSQVRDEVKTGGYGLLHLRSSKEWKQVRLDVGIENLFNRFYSLPLGGAYVGQRTAAWGTPVPGIGRTIYAGLSAKF